ncbi:MAG: carboxypeptidase-like regulatory domain-containing protein [Acidobacteriaceae bacterium]|nr:carboxypeptidase-like regulatory domain-containing protein [Acidobacteriaceae bacterium]
MLLAASARAQRVYEISGGDSTIFQSQGATFSMRARKYGVTLGAGRVFGEYGGGGEFQYFKNSRTTYSLGDTNMTFVLPTDIFMGGRMIYMTGAGAETTKENLHATVFGGMSSDYFVSPLFTGAQPNKPAVAAILEETAGKHQQLRLTQMALFSSHTSLMEGAEWNPDPGVSLGISGGLSNLMHNPYGAVSARIKRYKLDFRGQYVWYKGNTGLLNVATYQYPEPVRENVEAHYRVSRYLSLTGGRSNYLNFPSTGVAAGQTGSIGTSSHAGVILQVMKFGLSANAYQTAYLQRKNFGESFSVSRVINKWVNAGATYSQSTSHGYAMQRTETYFVTERIGPQFYVTQTLTNTNGRRMMNFGGQYFSNRFGADVQYVQTYIPTNTAHPFQSGYAVTGWANVYRFRFAYTQNIDPYGKQTYTVQGSWLSYGQPQDIFGPGSIHVGDFAVRGQVVDENGTPVEGMALLIDKKPVYTDADGKFEIRENKRSRHSITVTPAMATTINAYDVRTAPSSIESVSGDNPGVTIVVRKLQKLRGMM